MKGKLMLYRMILLAQHDFAAGNETIIFSGGEAPPPEMVAAGGFFILFILFWMVFCLVMTVALTIIPLWIICKKAGISPYISLLILVPGVNLAFYWILALINWPNLKAETSGMSIDSRTGVQ